MKEKYWKSAPWNSWRGISQETGYQRKRQEKLSEFFENPFMQKEYDFLKSPGEAPVHRKVLLEEKNISPKTQQAFNELCKKYEYIISKNSGDIGKTMLVEMEIETGNHPL